MEKYIKNITLWIRFDRCFRINDVLWAITDDLLYNESSPFKDMFKYQNQGQREMILEDNKGKYYMRINTDDIILWYDLLETENLNSVLVRFKKFYEYYKKLFNKYKIDNIKRVWIVFNHEIENNWIFFDEISSKLTRNQIKQTNSFSVTFSDKIEITEWKIKSWIEDYDNVIYLIQKVKNETILLNLDYQRYFIPSINLETIDELKFDEFISTSSKYLKDIYYSNLPFNLNDDVK